MLLPKLRPDYIFDSIHQVTPAFLRENGLTGMVLDIDDTLTGHDELDLPEKIYTYIESLKQAGITVCLFSNNQKERVMDTASKLNLSCVYMARKPSKEGYQRALDVLKIPKEQVCGVGDQVLTDVWGANRMGVTSMLVTPIALRGHNFFFKFKRAIERYVLKRGARIKDYRQSL